MYSGATKFEYFNKAVILAGSFSLFLLDLYLILVLEKIITVVAES